MRKAEAEGALIYFGGCQLKPFVELAKSITLTAATLGTRSHADAQCIRGICEHQVPPDHPARIGLSLTLSAESVVGGGSPRLSRLAHSHGRGNSASMTTSSLADLLKA